jgi:hypothetical protein
MRGIPARVLCAVAVGSMVAATAACGMSEETRAACDAIKKQLDTVATRAQEQVTEPSTAAKIYAEAATKVRAEADKAGGDVADAADKVAADMDSLAKTLEQAAKGTAHTPTANDLMKNSAELQEACAG